MPLTIEQRLQRLEGLIGTDSEALVPNNYSVDSSGNVNLSGIVLPAGTANTPATQSRIRWLRQSDGAVVATIYATEVLGRDTTELLSQATTNTNVAYLQLEALSLSQNKIAAILAHAAADSGGTSVVYAVADALTKKLLDGGGASDWLQVANSLSELIGSAATARTNLGLGSAAVQNTNDFLSFANAPTNNQVVWAAVTAQVGPTITATQSGGCTVTRNGVGQYTITFGTAFRNLGYVAVAICRGTQGYALIPAAGKALGSCEIQTNNIADAATDINFDFFAIGVT